MADLSIKAVEPSLVTIGPLDPSVSRAAFSCGNGRIDNYFRINVRDQHEKYRIRAYTAVIGGSVAGFYTLIAASRPPNALSEESEKKFGRVKYTPCVYLGMLGVDLSSQGKGLGKILMLDAMNKTLEIAERCGVYAMILDAVDAEKAEFYRKLGFYFFLEGELSMFMPLSEIRAALSTSED
jgi:GNAT superfamily N-acetyltransferase